MAFIAKPYARMPFALPRHSAALTAFGVKAAASVAKTALVNSFGRA